MLTAVHVYRAFDHILRHVSASFRARIEEIVGTPKIPETGMLKWTTLLFATLTLQAQTPAALPDGPGKPIVQRMCTACHTLKVVTSKRATKDQWTSTVHDMVARGADGTDDEVATVIDYLSTNFPAADKADPPPALSFAPGDDDALLTLPQPQFDRMLATWRQAYLTEKKGLGR